MSVKTEVTAGITTFLTMAYILAVHPGMLSEIGMDKGALFTTTAVSAAFATLLMAVIAKLPFTMAPGMGMNALFTYTVCLIMGYSWQFALTAVFLEGILFLLLTVLNLWDKIVNAIPATLKISIASGIGLYIAFIGLKNAGVVAYSPSTLVTLGDLKTASPLLALTGLVLTAALYIRQVPGALLLGILLTTLIGIPMGVTHLEGVVSTPPSMAPIFWQFEWESIFTTDMLFVVVTLLFVDLFGTVGTLVGLITQITSKGQMAAPPLRRVFLVSSLSVMSGAAMGTSTVTTFIECATGINAGGRSGLTSVVTSFCFLLSLFLAPFFLAVPSAATAPVLVIVGLMMMSNIAKVNFDDFSEALPAFVCVLMMPLSYSIADGMILGHLTYVVVNLLCGNYKKLTLGMYLLALVFSFKYMM